MTSSINDNSDPLTIARTVREACITAAKQAYEQAAISGLCDEGSVEAAIGAIETLDLEALLASGQSR